MFCPCGLDGPCTDAECEATGAPVYRCASCTAPFPSAAAARRCAEDDDDTCSLHVD